MASPVLLLGSGRMGTALLRGWIRRDDREIQIVEPHPSAELVGLTSARVRLLQGIEQASDDIEACIVALKPQILKEEIQTIRPVAQRALIVSIAAGSSIKLMRGAWGESARVVRSMPNTPGAIGAGITALFAPSDIGTSDRKVAETLLSALGETVWVDNEDGIDAVTAVSGSGPAYVFAFVEALAAAAEATGLSSELAMKLARKTVAGSAALMEASDETVEELRKNVTSPKGTTEAALKILLAQNGLPDIVERAVFAAQKRAKELPS